LLETWIPWLQRVMQDLADATRIQDARYNLDSLRDEALNERWGNYKILELEIKHFIKKVQSFGEKIVTFVVKLPNGEDLLYVRFASLCFAKIPPFNPVLQLLYHSKPNMALAERRRNIEQTFVWGL
jgi:hypothetical protein